MRSRSSSVSGLHLRGYRGGISLDRNNNYNARTERQTRLVHTTSKHQNEGFFGTSENIRPVDSKSSIEKLYEIGSLIGKGNFSKVSYALRKKDAMKCALKEIDKHYLRGKWFFIENEVDVLSLCRHENICQILDAFKTANKYYLVFQYAPNGDLFESIRLNGRMKEDLAALILSQIASALAYLHSRKIAHRDVKPENVLLFSTRVARLGDFGLACTVLGPLYRVCGTPTYCAPEILAETGYGTAVDVWSLGVVLHVMLVGHAPFRSQDRTRLFRLISQGKLHFELPEWRSISTRATDLVSRMLNTNIELRPRSCEIGSHPWVSSHIKYFKKEEEEE